MPRSGYTICTSEQRPASTTVSHGFAVERYSSPPFGSHGPRKHSEPCPLDCGSGSLMQPDDGGLGPEGPPPPPPHNPGRSCLHHALRFGSIGTLQLASSIDSLVRVTRRAGSATARDYQAKLHCLLPRAPSGGSAGRAQRPPSGWCSHRAASGPRGGSLARGSLGDWPARRQARTSVCVCQTLPIRNDHCASLRPWQAGCHRTGLPRLRPRPKTGAQWPARGWPEVAWGRSREMDFDCTRQRHSCKATAPLTAVPVEASGTFNPLHGVLCILPSLYLCAIGPRSVCFLAMDTPRTSNCSPKPLYSGMRSTAPRWVTAHSQRGGQYPSIVARSRALPGACDGHRGTAGRSSAHSICWNPR